MHWYTATTELLALRKEAFTGVSLANEGFVFVSKLVPEFVEMFVVRAVDNMTKPVDEGKICGP